MVVGSSPSNSAANLTEIVIFYYLEISTNIGTHLNYLLTCVSCKASKWPVAMRRSWHDVVAGESGDKYLKHLSTIYFVLVQLDTTEGWTAFASYVKTNKLAKWMSPVQTRTNKFVRSSLVQTEMDRGRFQPTITSSSLLLLCPIWHSISWMKKQIHYAW